MTSGNVRSENAFRTSERGSLAKLKNWIANRSRSRRSQLFFTALSPALDAKVLDLGGGKGRHFARHYPELTNVFIGDFNSDALDFAAKNFGYKTLLLDGSDRLPLDDKSFDVIFCSSVIEHVTGPKDEAVERFKRDGSFFRAEALKYQVKFAEEIRRTAKAYFVQTPYRYFPVEVHSWIPLVGYLPSHIQWKVIRVFNRFWPRKDDRPDWSLLTPADMARLFPDARIHQEKFMGITKSIIAIRS